MNSPVYRSSQPIHPRSDGWTNGAIIRTLSLISLFLGVLITLWRASDIMLLIFLGVLFGLAVSSGAEFLMRYRVPRPVGAALIIVAFIASLTGIASYVAPTLIEQAGMIRKELPASLEALELWLNKRTGGLASTIIADQTAAAAGDTTATASATRPHRIDIAQQVNNGINIATKYMFDFLSAGITVIAGFGLMLVLAAYVGAEVEVYRRMVLSLIPPTSRPRAEEVIAATAATMRKWLQTQLVAMIVIGVASYIAFKVIGVEAAFALALIAGLLEFIPTLGPILSGGIAVSIAFLASPNQALEVLIAAIVIQQLENNVLIPLLMKGGMDLPPALTLAAQGLMAILFGFAGMLVAVPLLCAIVVPIRMLYVEDTLGGAFHPAKAKAEAETG
jgi:predicted PurR-regulated permease PerM